MRYAGVVSCQKQGKRAIMAESVLHLTMSPGEGPGIARARGRLAGEGRGAACRCRRARREGTRRDHRAAVMEAAAPSLSETRPAGGSPGRTGAWWQGGQRVVVRSRWLACCLFLAAIPFATAPGDIIADTKFELVVNPSGFLSSALTLWDPQQFGGLLNQ